MGANRLCYTKLPAGVPTWRQMPDPWARALDVVTRHAVDSCSWLPPDVLRCLTIGTWTPIPCQLNCYDLWLHIAPLGHEEALNWWEWGLARVGCRVCIDRRQMTMPGFAPLLCKYFKGACRQILGDLKRRLLFHWSDETILSARDIALAQHAAFAEALRVHVEED